MAVAPLIRHHLALLDEAFNHKAWHGTTLRGSLRGVSAAQAAWRPGGTRHNIWELTVHAAYWKYAVMQRLAGGRRGAFAIKGSNWFVRPVEATDAAWRSDLRILDLQHRQLREVVAGLDVGDLPLPPPGSEQTRAYILRGIAAHDLYHAGQIQLVKRLWQDREA
jgi:hypothetical protein